MWPGIRARRVRFPSASANHSYDIGDLRKHVSPAALNAARTIGAGLTRSGWMPLELTPCGKCAAKFGGAPELAGGSAKGSASVLTDAGVDMAGRPVRATDRVRVHGAQLPPGGMCGPRRPAESHPCAPTRV